MDKLLTLFTQYDSKQFAINVRFFASEKRRELVTRFQDYVANSIQQVFLHGDMKHANKASYAAEMCGYGPTFRRCVVPIVPFKYDKDSKEFVGSIQKGKRSVMETLHGDGMPNWEHDLRAKFDDEGKPKDKADPDYLKRYINAVNAALKNGVEAADLRKALNTGIKSSVQVADSEVPTGDAQQAVIKTVARRKAA